MGARRIDGQAVNGRRRRLAEVIPLDTPYAIAMFPIYACNFKCSYCIHPYVTTIEKQIQAEYPDVKNVINILDLIHPVGERQQIA